MAVQVRRTVFLKASVVRGLMMTGMLMAQSLWGLASTQTASAATITDRVVINEVMAFPLDGQSEWVELYNPTLDEVSLSGWRVRIGADNASPVQEYAIATATIAAKGYVIVEVPDIADHFSNATEIISLADGSGMSVDELVYHDIVQGFSYARAYDAADTFGNKIAPTKAATNGSTATAPTITMEEFATNTGQYKGINVGFWVTNIKNVTDVSVIIERSSGGSVTKMAAAGLLERLNNDSPTAIQVSTPFVIQEGDYTEAGDATNWNPAAVTTWTKDTRPTKAIITITDSTGQKFSAQINTFTEAQGGTFASTLPFMTLAPVEPELEPTISELPLVAVIPLATPTPLPAAVAVFIGSTTTGGTDAVTPATTSEVAAQNAAVLGAQNNKTEASVARTGVLVASSDGWRIFNTAWYWWVLVAVAAMAVWMWLAAGIRRLRYADDL